MTKKLLFVTTILLVAAFSAFAADVTGKWTYEAPGRGGNPGRPQTITLKADGATLTGEVPGMGGRGGGGGTPPAPIAIMNGKVDGNKVYFEVKRAGRDGAETVTKYEGTVDGDTLTMKMTRPGQGGEPMVTDIVAKREKS